MAIAIAWINKEPLPVDYEPLTVIFGLLSGAVSEIARKKANALEEEKFSTSYALAHGYVENFLEPAVTEILQQYPESGKKLKFYIFMPKKLESILPKARQRILCKLRELNYQDAVVSLELSEGVFRDVLTLKRSSQQRAIYFDFPTTVLTLKSLVEYKVESRKDSFSDDSKNKLGEAYITKFKNEVVNLVKQKDIEEYVEFVGPDLEPLQKITDPQG